jgi:hypothetical protein
MSYFLPRSRKHQKPDHFICGAPKSKGGTCKFKVLIKGVRCWQHKETTK